MDHSEGGSSDQLRELLDLETKWARRLAARRVVLLDAPAEVLAARSADKFPGDVEPAFLGDLRDRFERVFADLPNVIRVDASRPLDEVVAEVADINARLA